MSYPPKAQTNEYKPKVTSLQISEEFLEFLTEEANVRGVSKADIIREGLDLWVKTNQEDFIL